MVGRLLNWLADGTVAGPRVTALPLAEASSALSRLDRGENIGKIILVPGPAPSTIGRPSPRGPARLRLYDMMPQ